jgi:alpha-mannosidase
MLTGGLPYHRRATRRMIDSLLIVSGEQQRKFRFGIGVNVSYAMAAAHDWMTPLISVKGAGTENGKNQNVWLFHFDCKNILATWWQPFFDEQSRWAGVQIRLRETEGRKGSLGIHCPRVVASGERVNFAGDFVRSLDVAKTDASKLEIEFDRFEFFQISIHWKR